MKRIKDFTKFFDAVELTLSEVITMGDSNQLVYSAWLNYETEKLRCYFHSALELDTLG